jgi:hypothetical protein
MKYEWILDCLTSLSHENVNIYTELALSGNTSSAREIGFKRGISKYVAFVDWDDIVIPGIFEKLYLACEENPDCSGAYSDEVLIDADGEEIIFGWSRDPKPFLNKNLDISFHKINGEYIHHLTLLKRKLVMEHFPLKTKRFPEPILLHELGSHGNFIHVKEVGYKWRRHPKNTILTYTKEEIEEAKNIIKEIDNGR